MRLSQRTSVRISIGLIAFAVTALLLFWLARRLNEGIAFAVNHKSMKHAPATVVSVSKPEYKDESRVSAERLKVCFTIDSFLEVAKEERGEYESAE